MEINTELESIVRSRVHAARDEVLRELEGRLREDDRALDLWAQGHEETPGHREALKTVCQIARESGLTWARYAIAHRMLMYWGLTMATDQVVDRKSLGRFDGDAHWPRLMRGSADNGFAGDWLAWLYARIVDRREWDTVAVLQE